RLDTLPDGYVFNDEMTMDVPALGQVHRAIARTQIDLGPSLELEGFNFVLESRIGSFRVSARAEGDSALAVVMDAGGGPQESRMAVGQGMLLDAALSLRMAASGALREGNEFTARIFDPSSMSERDVVVRVGAREMMVVTDSARLENGRWVASLLDTVPVFRVDQQFGGINISNWIDEDGQIVRAESPLGFTIERMYYELARQEWQGGQPADLALGYGALIEGTAISSDVSVTDVATTPRMRVRLGGVELEGFDLEGGRQTLRGDTLIVTRETLAQTRYRLPYRGSMDLADDLAATPLIQSDDPRIIETARRIAAGSTDPVVVAQRLNDWVFRALDKEVTLSVPSALQVLESRSGDCNEHTVLYVALARALGLPTRTAVGLVHIRDSFYYHAWPEVWLGEWVAVDPTLGQAPADASHLRFLVGGLARQVELIRLIGRLQLEVI
ncbi:MAG: transglutaminase domain-containing protein, partial [Gemmatimonadetes bacterium]|nr:transglutaminase domain-containing protein [Gemmatimonadota bacterium]